MKPWISKFLLTPNMFYFMFFFLLYFPAKPLFCTAFAFYNLWPSNSAVLGSVFYLTFFIAAKKKHITVCPEQPVIVFFLVISQKSHVLTSLMIGLRYLDTLSLHNVCMACLFCDFDLARRKKILIWNIAWYIHIFLINQSKSRFLHVYISLRVQHIQRT